jgi:hypothetical protein
MVRSKSLLGLSRSDLSPPDKQWPHQLVPLGRIFFRFFDAINFSSI